MAKEPASESLKDLTPIKIVMSEAEYQWFISKLEEEESGKD